MVKCWVPSDILSVLLSCFSGMHLAKDSPTEGFDEIEDMFK